MRQGVIAMQGSLLGYSAFQVLSKLEAKSRSHSLHKNSHFGPHHKAHQHCDNPCVNWWLGAYGLADCKGHAMHCSVYSQTSLIRAPWD